MHLRPRLHFHGARLSRAARRAGSAGNLTAAQALFSSLSGTRGEGFAQFLTPSTAAGVAIALQPTAVSFNIMMNAYARARLVDRAFKLLLDMRRAGVRPDCVTYTTLVKACVAAGQIRRAYDLLDDMDDLQIEPETSTYNAILKGLSAKLAWSDALELLARMERAGAAPDVLSYSYALSACVRSRQVQEASKLFREMQSRGTLPNQHVYSTMMAGFGACPKHPSPYMPLARRRRTTAAPAGRADPPRAAPQGTRAGWTARRTCSRKCRSARRAAPLPLLLHARPCFPATVSVKVVTRENNIFSRKIG